MKFPSDYIIHCEPNEKGTEVTMSGWEELIRCKDCKHAICIEQTDDWWECNCDNRALHGDGYCSWAERKEE